MATTLAQDAAALRTKRAARDKAKAKFDELKTECDQLEADLFDRMENEDVSGIKVGANNFVRTETIYGVVSDRAAFIEWAMENSPELIEPKERKALVNEVVRERIDNGETLPPGLNHFPKQYISQRAA